MKKYQSAYQRINRRYFVKRTSLGLGALGLGMTACGPAKKEESVTAIEESAPRKLGIALVGLG